MTATTRRRLRNVVAVLLVFWLVVFFPRFVIPVFVNLVLGLGVELPLPSGLFREYPDLALVLFTFGPVVILGLLSLALVRLMSEPSDGPPAQKS